MTSAVLSTVASRLLVTMSASAIAGMASTTAHVIKRSDILLLSLVRISTCLLSQFPYTSASLYPFLSLSSLSVVSSMVAVGCLPVATTDYRVGRSVPSAGWLFLSIYLRLSYMPCGLLSCVFVCQGTPNGVCTTHIVAK